MPKRSSKSKSKRLSLRQKYKILRKVKEHHKKKRKELRKTGGKTKPLKDPGIPSQWPFKEELVKELAWKRQQILEKEKAEKAERKRARTVEEGIDMAVDEQPKTPEEKPKKQKTGENSGAVAQDNSRKSFYKDFKRAVEMSDVVLEMLDARDPAACRCLDIERYIRSVSPDKKIVLVLNKIDLVPREASERWLRYLREELPTVAFRCSTQQQADRLSQRSSKKSMARSAMRRAAPSGAASGVGGGSACLGADTLLQLLKNYQRNSGLNAAVTVCVVGLPNVGKSSLINSLKRGRVAQVGNTPGVTRGLQEIQLTKHVKLLDTPGVVFTPLPCSGGGSTAALLNAVKIEQLQDPAAAVAEILSRVAPEALCAFYKLPAFSGPDEFLQLVATNRGKLKKGGVADSRAAARIVLQDWNQGRISYYTEPPERDQAGVADAQIVQEWSAAFDVSSVYQDEASTVLPELTSADDGGRLFVASTSSGAMQVDLAPLNQD